MRACLSTLLVLSMLPGLSACDGSGGKAPKGADIARSSKERVTSPDVPDADVEALAAGNRDFAFDLYAELRGEEGNLFYSPYSISVALAMTYAGAEGQTEAQMRDAMSFDLPEERLHPAFNATDLALASRGERASGSDAGPFRLNVVNATWAQQGYELLPSYLDVLAESYGSAIYLLDFVDDPNGSRLTINDWVEEQTENRIEELIPEGVITPITVLVLTNAIYFNAAWENPFDEESTEPGDFDALAGGTVELPMMRQTKEMPYAEGDGYKAVSIPYDAPELSMIAIVPDAGRFEEVEAGFDAALLGEVEAGLHDRGVTLTMPRFEIEASFSLKDALMTLGMTDAFGGEADFSGMDGTRSLFIQAVLHKAFVSVNEAGTEAAAATAVVVGRVSAPEPATITLDRPFLFAIVDRPTGQVLFVGRFVG